VIESLRIWVSRKHDALLPSSPLRARFATGVLWSVGGSVISRGFAFLAAVFCARLLGKIQFGELGMIQSTAGLFGIFAGLGLGLTATKYVAEFRGRDHGKAGRVLAISAVFAVISGMGMTLLLILMSTNLAARTLAAPRLAIPLAIGSGLVLFGAINGAQTGALAGLEAFRMIALVNMWAGISSLPLIVVGVWKWGLQGAVCGSVAAMAANCLLNNVAIRRECRKAGIRYDFHNCFREIHVLHKFSLPAFLASIVVGPALWVCNAMLVNRPDGYADMGLYTAADKWRLMILFVPTSLAGTTLPMLSNLYGDDAIGYARVLRANLLLNLGLTVLPTIIVSLLSIPILSLYGPGYRSAWPILVILAVAAIPESLNNSLGYAVLSSASVWWRFWFDALLAVVLVGFAWWAIPRWSGVGLAIAYALAFSLTAAGLFVFLRVRSPRELGVVAEVSG